MPVFLKAGKVSTRASAQIVRKSSVKCPPAAGQKRERDLYRRRAKIREWESRAGELAAELRKVDDEADDVMREAIRAARAA
jgi:hypothetical protein